MIVENVRIYFVNLYIYNSLLLWTRYRLGHVYGNCRFICVENEFCVDASEWAWSLLNVNKDAPDQLLKKSFLLYCEICFLYIRHWCLITITNVVSDNPFAIHWNETLSVACKRTLETMARSSESTARPPILNNSLMDLKAVYCITITRRSF